MKKLLLTLSMVSGSVLAQEPVIRDHYKTITETMQVPTTVCSDVTVTKPVEGKPSGGAILLGAIVGNAIGRAAGVDGGQTAGTIIGGIAGSEISKQGSGESEVRVENRCFNEVRYVKDTRDVYAYSTITFRYNNKEYSLRFIK